VEAGRTVDSHAVDGGGERGLGPASVGGGGCYAFRRWWRKARLLPLPPDVEHPMGAVMERARGRGDSLQCRGRRGGRELWRAAQGLGGGQHRRARRSGGGDGDRRMDGTDERGMAQGLGEAVREAKG
jgi:hypothetical protein